MAVKTKATKKTKILSRSQLASADLGVTLRRIESVNIQKEGDGSWAGQLNQPTGRKLKQNAGCNGPPVINEMSKSASTDNQGQGQVARTGKNMNSGTRSSGRYPLTIS